MAPRRRKAVKKKEPKVIGRCGECKHCTYLTDFHTLSLLGKPTLGSCPYWKKSKSVLLSLDTCEKFERK